MNAQKLAAAVAMNVAAALLAAWIINRTPALRRLVNGS